MTIIVRSCSIIVICSHREIDALISVDCVVICSEIGIASIVVAIRCRVSFDCTTKCSIVAIIYKDEVIVIQCTIDAIVSITILCDIATTGIVWEGDIIGCVDLTCELRYVRSRIVGDRIGEMNTIIIRLCSEAEITIGQLQTFGIVDIC